MIQIRRMTMEDVDRVSQLEEKTFSMPWHRESFIEMISNPLALYMVAVDGDELMGTCGMLTVAGEADISNVAVDEKFRRRGVAYELVQEAMCVAGRDFGVKDFTLEVRAGNKAAIGLYEKLGFVSEGVRPNFYEMPVEDALIMWKRD